MHVSLAALTLAFASALVHAAKPFVLFSPPVLATCTLTWIEWHGGVAPFTLSVLQQIPSRENGTTTFVRDAFPNLTERRLSYLITASKTVTLAFKLQDASGESRGGSFRQIEANAQGEDNCNKAPPEPVLPVVYRASSVPAAGPPVRLEAAPTPTALQWTWDETDMLKSTADRLAFPLSLLLSLALLFIIL